jgi:predicted phosphodiesterase
MLLWRWIGWTVIAGVSGVLAFCLWCAVSLPPLKPLPQVGNFPDVVQELERLPADRPARIAFVGDPNEFRVYNLPDYLRAAAAVRPDVIVLAGDLVHGESSPLRMRLALDEIRRACVGVPIIVAVGNHDVNPREDAFVRAFGARRMEFRLRGVRLVLDDLKRPGPVWLPGGNDTLLFVHEPIYHSDGTHTRYARHVVEAAEPPALILTGHEHHFRDIRVRGTRQITAGGDDRYIVLIEATPESVHTETVVRVPGRTLLRRLVHFGVRAADDIARLRPKALSWVLAVAIGALLVSRLGGGSRAGAPPRSYAAAVAD